MPGIAQVLVERQERPQLGAVQDIFTGWRLMGYLLALPVGGSPVGAVGYPFAHDKMALEAANGTRSCLFVWCANEAALVLQQFPNFWILPPATALSRLPFPEASLAPLHWVAMKTMVRVRGPLQGMSSLHFSIFQPIFHMS